MSTAHVSPATAALSVRGPGDALRRARGAARRQLRRRRAASWSRSSGPNGAGKTTLLSILAGIQRPSAGSVSRDPREVGWVPQQPALYSKLSVAENLALFARLERVADPDAAVERMLEQTGLRERASEQLARLSGGNRQRVNVAIGLLSRPPVLALDEPSTALDPGQRERLWSFIRGLARRRHERRVLHARRRRGAALRRARARARRRPAAVRRHPRGVPRARRGGDAMGTSRTRSCRSCARGASDDLAAAQGPPDPAPLAPDGRAARALPRRDRAADRAGALARPLQATRRDRQRNHPRRDASKSAAAASTSASTPRSCSTRSKPCRPPRARRPSRRSSRATCSPPS